MNDITKYEQATVKIPMTFKQRLGAIWSLCHFWHDGIKITADLSVEHPTQAP